MDKDFLTKEILLHRHRLSPKQVNDWLGVDAVQEDVQEKIRAMEKVREFIRITDAFRAHEITFVPLKGPILSHQISGDPTWRYYRDLDILVEVENVTETCAILLGNGYSYVLNKWPDTYYGQRVLSAHTNQISLYNPQENVTVEIHWQLLKSPAISFEKLLKITRENLKPVEFAGRTFTVLSDELNLLFLIIHGGNHYWRRLKWLVDIHFFLKSRSIDLGKFDLLAHSLRAEKMVGLFNTVYRNYFPSDVTLGKYTHVPEFMVKYSLGKMRETEDLEHDTFMGMAQARYFSLISFPGLLYKNRILRNYLFVEELYGRNRLFSTIPLFYFYGYSKLAINRIARILRRKNLEHSDVDIKSGSMEQKLTH